MQRAQGLTWLFLDLNSYFASVEQQENPALRGRPVAVVPLPTDSTCVIAASYEAKAYGIKTGTPVYLARQMCPNLRCVLARHDMYVTYHHRVIDEVIKHTPINKIWSIDELSSRLPPGRRDVDSARAVAERIKAGLRQNVGTHITCSIGVAPNTLLAKMAADMKKPDGLTILRQEDLPGPLLDLPLTDIPGVGENMHRRLQRARIRTMADLWATAPKHARKIWASVQGERLWYWLHGYDFEGPPTHPVMIGHSRMLDPALRPQAQARLMARRLMTKATYRLRRAGYFACGVGLSTRSIHGLRWAGEQRIAPARDPLTFLNILENLWAGMRNDLAPHAASGLSLKKVSVVLTGLKQAHDITDDLLIASSPKAVLDLKKREALAAALDHLQTKYRRETVCLGVPPKTLGGHVGTKIAFARVPDAEEFWC